MVGESKKSLSSEGVCTAQVWGDHLSRACVSDVRKALSPLSPAEQLVFWKRAHGALGGKTVLQTLSDTTDAAQLSRVTELGRAWALEAYGEADIAALARADNTPPV